MKPISLIVTDSGPLITLAISGALDTLLLSNVHVIVPDMVRFEVVNHQDKPGAKEVLNWLRNNESNNVTVGSTEVWEEFSILRNANPAIKSKNRGELAASEILERELKNGAKSAIFLFEDSDVKKANFLIRMPDNVLVMSTSLFLDGLKHKGLIPDSDLILNKAVSIRGLGILTRQIIPTSGAEDLAEEWKPKI